MALPKPSPFHLGALLALPLLAAMAGQAVAQDYAADRHVGAWYLAKKTNPAGKPVEMMAVSALESDADFFLVMCDSTTQSLYVSLVTSEPSLASAKPPRLDVSYAFDDTASRLQMNKAVTGGQVILRNAPKADVEALIAEAAKSHLMRVTAGSVSRSFDLTGFTQAFDIVDTACRASAAP
jgi:hypothetical protein